MERVDGSPCEIFLPVKLPLVDIHQLLSPRKLMPQETPLTTAQLANVLKIPEALVLSFRDQGLFPPAIESADEASDTPRYNRSEVVQGLRQYPEAMDAIRRAMRQ